MLFHLSNPSSFILSSFLLLRWVGSSFLSKTNHCIKQENKNKFDNHKKRALTINSHYLINAELAHFFLIYTYIYRLIHIYKLNYNFKKLSSVSSACLIHTLAKHSIYTDKFVFKWNYQQHILIIIIIKRQKLNQNDSLDLQKQANKSNHLRWRSGGCIACACGRGPVASSSYPVLQL